MEVKRERRGEERVRVLEGEGDGAGGAKGVGNSLQVLVN